MKRVLQNAIALLLIFGFFCVVAWIVGNPPPRVVHSGPAIEAGPDAGQPAEGIIDLALIPLRFIKDRITQLLNAYWWDGFVWGAGVGGVSVFLLLALLIYLQRNGGKP